MHKLCANQANNKISTFILELQLILRGSDKLNRLLAGLPGFDPGRRRDEDFLYSFVSSLVLGSTKPPVK